MSSSSSSLSAPSNASSPNKSGSPDEKGAQKFYSHGKRIPKDVKRHCGMCKQHGVIVETRGHTCEYKNCNCEHCELVRKRREIMSTQIRLRREQDKKFQRTDNISEANVFPGCTGESVIEQMNMCYFCQKCKNHNILVWKKNHKKDCQFANCECDQCSLIDSRRALDRDIKKRRVSGKRGGLTEEGGATAPKSPKKESSASASNSASSTSLNCTSDESASSSSDCSLSGMLKEKLNVAPNVQVKFDFSTGGFIAPSGGKVSPIETTPSPLPLLLTPNSQVPMTFPTPTLPFFPLPPLVPPTLFPSSLIYPTSTYLANPFLMPMTTIDMQILFQNIQNLREMTAAVGVAADTD